MTSSECQVCTAPTGDGSQLCSKCVRKLSEEIRSVSWLVTELEVTRTRQARFTRQQDGNTSSSATTPLPWDDRASLMQGELNATINAWALTVSKVDEDTRDPLSGVPVATEPVSRWLNRNLVTLRKMDVAGRAHHELIDVIRRARMTVDRPPDLVTYGMCGNTDPDETNKPTRAPCDEYLYAAPGKLTIKCRKCGVSYDVTVRVDWMLTYARTMIGTASEVAIYLRMVGIKVTSDSIRSMKNRNRIRPVSDTPSRAGKDEPVLLYRFSDVIDACAQRYVRKPKMPKVHASS